MIQATLIVLFLGTGLCHASAVANTVAGNGNAGCEYEVISKSKWVTRPIDPRQYGYYSSKATTLDRCIKLCDDHSDCVSAEFNPDTKQGPTCYAAIQLGFSKQLTESAKNPDSTVVQLVANSCDKPVATPTPVGCKPGIKTDRDGCKYKVTCNEQIDHLPFASILSLKSAEECFRGQVAGAPRNYGLTWYQGGDCRVNYHESGYPKVLNAKTNPRARTETIQIVKGSCDKAM